MSQCGQRHSKVPARTLPPELHGQKEHDAVLLVALADDVEDSAEPVNTVAYMRGSRMVIKETAVRGLPVGSRPFRALVLAGEAASDDEDAVIAERFLRAAEPPEHNNWVVTRKVTDAYPRGAKTALDEFFEQFGRDSLHRLGANGDPFRRSRLIARTAAVETSPRLP